MPDDAQVTHRNFWVLRVLGSALRLKAEADSRSRGPKDFICREEKRKAAWGHAAGPGNWWFCGSVGQVINWVFTAFFFYFPRVDMSLWCKQMFPGKEKCLPG
jgi:hypothetical protein